MAPVRHSSNTRDGVTPRDDKPTRPTPVGLSTLRGTCPYCHGLHATRAEFTACRVSNTEGGA